MTGANATFVSACIDLMVWPNKFAITIGDSLNESERKLLEQPEPEGLLHLLLLQACISASCVMLSRIPGGVSLLDGAAVVILTLDRCIVCRLRTVPSQLIQIRSWKLTWVIDSIILARSPHPRTPAIISRYAALRVIDRGGPIDDTFVGASSCSAGVVLHH